MLAALQALLPLLLQQLLLLLLPTYPLVQLLQRSASQMNNQLMARHLGSYSCGHLGYCMPAAAAASSAGTP
jgi:hypothetical protein